MYTCLFNIYSDMLIKHSSQRLCYINDYKVVHTGIITVTQQTEKILKENYSVVRTK